MGIAQLPLFRLLMFVLVTVPVSVVVMMVLVQLQALDPVAEIDDAEVTGAPLQLLDEPTLEGHPHHEESLGIPERHQLFRGRRKTVGILLGTGEGLHRNAIPRDALGEAGHGGHRGEHDRFAAGLRGGTITTGGHEDTEEAENRQGKGGKFH